MKRTNHVTTSIEKRKEVEKRMEGEVLTAYSSKKRIKVPIWLKSNLTLEEAAAYSGIGINKLRELSNNENCKFVLWIGSKRLIKRRLLDEFIDSMFSI